MVIRILTIVAKTQWTIYKKTIDEFMKNDLFMCSFSIQLIWEGYIHISEVDKP